MYKQFSTFPLPKVVSDNPGIDYSGSWKRLSSPLVSCSNRDTIFLLLHNKLAVPERKFRIGFRDSPFCSSCPGNIVSDVVHFFCQCIRSKICWQWVRGVLESVNPDLVLRSEIQLLSLDLPNMFAESWAIWLISEYVGYAWSELSEKESHLKLDKFFGFLTFK